MIGLTKGKIALVPLFDPDVTPGGIIVPDVAKERVDQGLVKYMGAGVAEDYGLSIGDYVIFSGYSGDFVNIEGEGRVIIMHAKSVVAKLLDPPTIDVAGLYFRGVDGTYFVATYEQAMEFIARSFTEYGKTLKVKTEIPRNEDYNDG